MTIVHPETTERVSPGPVKSRRGLLVKLARAVLVVVVVAAVAFATTRQWSQVKEYLQQLPVTTLVMSLMAALAGVAAGAMAFRAGLRAIGHSVPIAKASQIYLVGLLGKYVPGSVWTFVIQAELGKNAGLIRTHILVASLATTGIFTTAALVVGVAAVPELATYGLAAVLPFAIVIVAALACSHPWLLTRIVRVGLRLLRQEPLPSPFTWTSVGRVGAWCGLSLLCFGTHLWLLAKAALTDESFGFLACLATVGLALAGGIVAFALPSGIGAREAMMVVALAPHVSTGSALGIALVSRMIFIAADLLAAGTAAIVGNRHRDGEANAQIGYS